MENKTILLVADDPEDRILTLRARRKNNLGNKVFVARDGAEALDFLFCRNTYADRDPHNMRQLSLLDIKLLKMDGLKVLHHLRADQRTKRLPIVLLTSSKEVQDLVEGYKRGAKSCIGKSVDFTQFVEAIRQIGMYWLTLNEAPPVKGRTA